MKKYATSLFAVLAAIMILFAGCTAPSGESGTANADTTQSTVQTQRQSDGGKGICYNVFCYNNQPGISIDYKTGESSAQSSSDTFDNQSTVGTYIVNTNTKKFHKTTCSSVQSIKEKNKKKYTGNRENLINNGYSPCKKCKP